MSVLSLLWRQQRLMLVAEPCAPTTTGGLQDRTPEEAAEWVQLVLLVAVQVASCGPCH